MKRALAPIVLVLLLGLSGCVSVETTESRVEVTPGASGTYSDGDSTVVVEPLTTEASDAPAAPVEVTAQTEPSETPDESAAPSFLIRTQLALDNWGVKMNADQVRSASDYVCDQIEAGVDPASIVAITGEVPDYANGDFVDVISQGYCPIR